MNARQDVVVRIHDALFPGAYREDPMTYPPAVFATADEFLADPEGQSLVARIHDRKRLTQELAAADAVYTQAVQAAVAKQCDWARVRQAAEVVRQCRAAVKASGEEE